VSTAALTRQFEAQRPAGGPPDVQRLRTSAFERFAAAGFPTRRHEDWKYTDLKPLADGDFVLTPARPSDASCARVAAFLEENALEQQGPQLVFVDGHFVEPLSRVADAGVAIQSLATRWTSLGSARPGSGSGRAHPLAFLNAAFAEHGAVIEVPANVTASAPIHLIFVAGGADGLAPQPRVVIEMGRHSQLTVVQHFVDCEAVDGWLNVVTDVTQGEGSQLTLYRLQEHAGRQFHTALLAAELSRDAALTAGLIDLGGRLARNDVDVVLAAPGAVVELFGLSVPGEGQHIDNHLRVDHIAPDTRSIQAFRSIVGHGGHGVFNGKVVVRPGAQRIDARQTSDNLLLSDRAEIDTKPELEIYADDVKCSHGATIGALDEEQLFYLRARGIDADAARSLLTFAFANRTIRRIGLESLRDRVTERVAGHLPDRGRWESLA
jgi:Fe-S cluster assembly protein SufD